MSLRRGGQLDFDVLDLTLLETALAYHSIM